MATPLYRNERFWQKAKRKLFGSVNHTNFAIAEIAIPMRYRIPKEVTREEQSIINLTGVCLTYPELKNHYANQAESAREGIAALLNVPAEQVYLTSNTHAALDFVLRNFSPTADQNVVTTKEEYPGMPLVLNDYFQGRIKTVKASADAIATEIDSNTKVVFVSHVTHDTGRIVPIEEIVEAAHAREVPVIVDAAQSIGQIPLSVQGLGVDAVVGCGHKWLHGETISGFFYIDEQMERSTYVHSSPYSIPPGKRSADIVEALWDYDGGGNVRALDHLAQVLEHLGRLGWGERFARISYLGSIVRERLEAMSGVEVLTPEHYAPGMVIFRMGDNQGAVRQYLDGKGVVVTHKQGELLSREDEVLRVATSPFNTVKDINRLERALREYKDI